MAAAPLAAIITKKSATFVRKSEVWGGLHYTGSRKVEATRAGAVDPVYFSEKSKFPTSKDSLCPDQKDHPFFKSLFF